MTDTYVGKNLDLQWIYSGGTIALNADFRTFNYTPSVQLIDQSRGADLAKRYLANLKDGQATLTALNPIGGTAIAQALVEGASGTLIVGREGTATGKPKLTIPAICQGAKFTIPYDNNVELACDFQQNGLRVETAY
jgi:hypothetical protein